jgi:hypothetical protein
VQIPLSDTYYPEFVAGDFNGDGKADLVGTVSNLPSQTDVYVDVFLSNGRTFRPPQKLRTGSISIDAFGAPGPFALATGDLNGDGTPDVVFVSDDHGGTWTIQAILMNVLQ